MNQALSLSLCIRMKCCGFVPYSLALLLTSKLVSCPLVRGRNDQLGTQKAQSANHLTYFPELVLKLDYNCLALLITSKPQEMSPLNRRDLFLSLTLSLSGIFEKILLTTISLFIHRATLRNLSYQELFTFICEESRDKFLNKFNN